MKTILVSLATLLSTTTMFAQVGINTDTPQRTLDVNGNLRIRTLSDKSQTLSYNKILVINNNGDVDYINKSDLKPIGDEFTSDKQVLNNIYTTNDGRADDSKFVSCGKFDFAFKNTSTTGTGTSIQFRLKTAPTGANQVTVYTTLEQNWETNGYEFQSPESGRTFTSSNTFIDLPTSGAGIVSGELNILYLLYPGDSDLYRLTFYRLNQNTTPLTYDFVTACEKF
ncbi:hypothetical protein HXZ62_04295 [Empedobacter falsenii]|uniref:hypothetical protein n=1 Tax=Empedobacter TaxID=59734 RepID=UPI002577EE7C|nr:MULTISPECIES: hypothetical protein [Empedobacter]MDM1061787.1 hypothetical protein [Empedobacter falsenii]